MLYRHKQGTFEVCPFKAVYTALIIQIEEDEPIEINGEMIPKQKAIEVKEQRESYISDKEQFELMLSNSSEQWINLNYINVELSEEQLKRYEEIRGLIESSIGECIDYVRDGIFPTGNNHALRHIQVEKENIRLGQELSDREINEIIQGIQLSEFEIQLLILMMGGE